MPLIAPRPLLVASGELDPRCPLPGVIDAVESAKREYRSRGALDQVRRRGSGAGAGAGAGGPQCCCLAVEGLCASASVFWRRAEVS